MLLLLLSLFSCGLVTCVPGEDAVYISNLHSNYLWTSSAAQRVRNPSAMWEAWVRSLGWEDPLGEGHSSILAWIILWTEEPGGLQSMGPQRVIHD